MIPLTAGFGWVYAVKAKMVNCVESRTRLIRFLHSLANHKNKPVEFRKKMRAIELKRVLFKRIKIPTSIFSMLKSKPPKL